ncbi:MAG TPA: twin-arginine translocase TatA/TatE family subunit [Vicinamibacterales bacterium]|nr:twin-arginine translocase TatA/TatE family subunit [Vicinamibacterales bacterium]
MFGSLGMPELLVIFVIALMIFGPRKLPELGKALGQTMNEFKKGANGLRQSVEAEIAQEHQQQSAPVQAAPAQAAAAGTEPRNA